jgi:hypothetical protein
MPAVEDKDGNIVGFYRPRAKRAVPDTPAMVEWKKGLRDRMSRVVKSLKDQRGKETQE